MMRYVLDSTKRHVLGNTEYVITASMHYRMPPENVERILLLF